jgi:hypothetical protein
MTKTSVWRGLPLALAAGILVLVPGCREEEQDQVLIHEKGVYQGEEDQPLGEPMLEDLRGRARIQGF